MYLISFLRPALRNTLCLLVCMFYWPIKAKIATSLVPVHHVIPRSFLKACGRESGIWGFLMLSFFLNFFSPWERGEVVSVPCQSRQRPLGQRLLERHRTCELRPLDGRRAGLLRVLLGTEFDTSRQTNGAGRRYILPSSVAEYWRRARIFESYRFFFYRCRILLFSLLQNFWYVYVCGMQ